MRKLHQRAVKPHQLRMGIGQAMLKGQTHQKHLFHGHRTISQQGMQRGVKTAEARIADQPRP
jgi:hypothetical protein